MRTCIWMLALGVMSCMDALAQIPRDTSYTPHVVWNQIQKNYPDARIAKAEFSKGSAKTTELVYATIPQTDFGKRELHLDVFQPVKKGIYPAIIMIHGGGWRSGDKSMQWPMAERLARKGFVTVCVEYQLSLEAKYPAALHNVKAAVRFIRANCKKFNIDPEKIAISGCSAGGQLAMLTAMTNNVSEMEGTMGDHSDTSSAVSAVVDIDGVVDFLSPRSLNLKRKPDAADVAWLGGTFYEKPEVWKDASAIFWANEKSVPVLFINSGYPRFHAGQDELIAMMNEWGIYSEVHKVDVKVHPFWLFDPWIDPTVEVIEKFLKKVLGK